MARVSTYLNFKGRTEEAFNFYRKVFKTEFSSPIQRMGSVSASPAMPSLTEAEKNLVMHVELPILAGHILMATDALESMGHHVTFGNNVTINLEPDTRQESRRLFDALAEGGKVGADLQDMFWGSLWGSLTDPFGVHWMINCYAK